MSGHVLESRSDYRRRPSSTLSTELELALVTETMQPGPSVSYVAPTGAAEPAIPLETADERRGKEAVRTDDAVVAASEMRRLQERVRELERLLGRKTMEVEILKEALDLARAKNRCCCRPRCRRENIP
jgi:transposase